MTAATTTEDSDATTTRRRPNRNHNNNNNNNGTTLASSFKQFVGNASATEIQMFSTQLTAALNAVSLNDDQTSFSDASSSPLNNSNNGSDNNAADDNINNKDNNGQQQQQQRPRSESNSSDFYQPQPTSRRNSKAGEELVKNMKLTAAELLAELGDISDDDDDAADCIGNRVGLASLREESVGAVLREDSSCRVSSSRVET